MYVDDPEAEARKTPAMAARFRKKDPSLKDKLRQIKPGILRWLVEGAREWRENGLAPPASIIDAVQQMADEEDFVGRFMRDCLLSHPGDSIIRVATGDMYEAFRWWWNLNMDESEKRMPSMKAINSAIRDKGHLVEATGGRTWIYGHSIKQEITDEIAEFNANRR